MHDYRAELERRIDQFCSYLEPMDYRAHEVAHGPCFMTFEEHGSDSSGQQPREDREPALAPIAAAFSESGGVGNLDPYEALAFDLADEGSRRGDSHNRFIQFSFEKYWYCMDIPRQTLRWSEAMEILWHWREFFYLRDRAQFTLHGEDVEGYDPFRKIYLYGDEESAAEDMAVIFFRVWGLPVDSHFCVSAASFGGEHKWEQGVSIR